MEKLRIVPRRAIGKSSVVSVRLPDDITKKLDDISIKTGRSRNELLIQMIDYALLHIELVTENT